MQYLSVGTLMKMKYIQYHLKANRFIIYLRLTEGGHGLSTCRFTMLWCQKIYPFLSNVTSNECIAWNGLIPERSDLRLLDMHYSISFTGRSFLAISKCDMVAT